jgi:hypothetical protein
VIVVKLFGGLGNQMFQYAAARRLALMNETEVALDLRWFSTQQMRDLALDRLSVRAAPATDAQLIPGLPAEWTGSGRRISLRWRVAARQQGQRLIAESRPGVFQPAVLRAPDHTTLVGYWQSERYFSDVAEMLRDELTPKYGLSGLAAQLRDEIHEAGGVSLHVRRGDFVRNPEAARAHGVCSAEYYRSAMALLDSELGSPTYYGFSDDPDWTLANLRHPRLHMVTTRDRVANSHEDLALMASCRAHIVANSSFSWWGAWLGDGPDKRVVAPRRWFEDPRLSSQDIVPASWCRL